jgi:histidinol phosphatase-like enzyme (inositol monophosphatase family)
MGTSKYARFIRTLAEKSGEVIRSYYAMDNLIPEIKEDMSPVTRADREAEELMRGLIRKAYPDHGIIGEEFGSENVTAEFVWTLDPIDGTASFTNGCPLFGTLICLLHEQKPIIGAVNIPMLERLCIGDYQKTTINGRTVQCRNTTRLSDAVLLTTDVMSIWRDNKKNVFNSLVEQTRLFRTWGDCYGYLLVASGKADIMLDTAMAVWDYMPLIPIIEGAGGTITVWSGEGEARGMQCLATNKDLHPHVLKMFKK